MALLHNMAKSPGRKLMTEYDRLPRDFEGTIYVTTETGSVHIFRDKGRLTWQRIPGPGAPRGMRDRFEGIVSVFDRGWAVGDRGSVVLADSSYIQSPTSHTTSMIISISDVDPR